MTDTQTGTHTTTPTFIDRYLTPLSVVLGAGIIAFALANGNPAGAPRADLAAAVGAADVSQLDLSDNPFIGDPNAPAAIAVFSDFQCPFCKQFDLEVMPRLIDTYVESGLARIYFMDFQFLGEDSLEAAVFGRAVWESAPASFYPWFLAVMSAQDQGGDQGFGDLASIRTLSATIPGIDLTTVDRLIAENRARYEAAAAADRDEAAAMGVNGTPSVIVGTELISALAPDDFYEAIASVLDRQLPR